MKRYSGVLTLAVVAIFAATGAWAKAISEQTAECVECHQDGSPGVVIQWQASPIGTTG